MLKDKQQRIFTDPAKVHQVNHQGQFYRSQGVFQVSPSVQRTPVLFQAGASPRGMAFATQHTEGMFIGGDHPDKIKNRLIRFVVRPLNKAVILKRSRFLSALPS